MATKGKTKKKQTKVVPMKKTVKRKLTDKRINPKKNLAKEKAAPKKAEVKQVRGENQSVNTVAFEPEGPRARSGEQAGDLQGLSNVPNADSESVDELLEEGNAFEADAVKGVEDAGDTDEREVRTHEVPQDDIPDEYLEKK
jgi:N utilization substance protein A